MAGPLETPVLFIIFNRPDTAARVFEAIRQARPKKLYVAADGPREGKEGEKELCERTRSIIDGVDWPCEVHRRFLDQNLGCKAAVSSAITWFFDNVEEGIILEDDCLPHPTFFPYCQEMLSRYRDEPRVMMVQGTNFLPAEARRAGDYYFSKHYSIWGWASWRRAWMKYDIKMSRWPELREEGKLERIYGDQVISAMVRRHLKTAYDGKVNTWDYQWDYSCLINDGLSVSPSRNLVANIGTTGTHDMSGNPFLNMPTHPMNVGELTHPREVEQDIRLDRESFWNIIEKQPEYRPIAFRAFAYLFSVLNRINPDRWGTYLYIRRD